MRANWGMKLRLIVFSKRVAIIFIAVMLFSAPITILGANMQQHAIPHQDLTQILTNTPAFHAGLNGIQTAMNMATTMSLTPRNITRNGIEFEATSTQISVQVNGSWITVGNNQADLEFLNGFIEERTGLKNIIDDEILNWINGGPAPANAQGIQQPT